MGRVSYTSTARAGLPVELRFCCAKCGKEVRATRYMYISAESYGGGSFQYAQASARNRLSATASAQVKAIAENIARGAVPQGTSPNGLLTVSPLVCPVCGLANWPKRSSVRQIMTPKWFVPSLITFPVVLLVAWLATMDWQIHESNMPGWLFGALVAAFFLYLILFLVINHRLTGKPLDHPKLFEKVYKSVLNDEIYADLTPYGLGEIHVGSEK